MKASPRNKNPTPFPNPLDFLSGQSRECVVRIADYSEHKKTEETSDNSTRDPLPPIGIPPLDLASPIGSPRAGRKRITFRALGRRVMACQALMKKSTFRTNISVPSFVESEAEPNSPEDIDGPSPRHYKRSKAPAFSTPQSPRSRTPKSVRSRKWQRRVDVQKPTQLARVQAFISFFHHSAKKHMTYLSLPFQLLLVLSLTLTIFLSRTEDMSLTSRGLETKYFSNVKSVVAEPHQVTPLSEHFLKILPMFIHDLWSPTRFGQARPILSLAIQQYRRGLEPCIKPSIAMPEDDRRVIPSRCFSQEWSAEPLEYRDKNNVSQRYLSSKGFGHDRTREYFYAGSAPQFVEMFSFENETEQDVLLRIDSLRNNSWIREGVAAIFIEAFFINTVDKHYTHSEVLFEALSSGYTTISSATYTFVPPSIDTNVGRSIFVCDLLLAVSVFLMIYELIRSVRFNLCFHEGSLWASIDKFDCANLLIIILLIVLLHHRYGLWHITLTHPSNGNAFVFLMDYKYASERADILVTSMIMLSYMRFFMYTRYNERVCVIAETMRSSTGYMSSMVLISGFVLFGYAMTTLLLFGTHVKKFQDLSSVIPQLVLTMITGEFEEYWDEVREESTVMAHILFISFLVVSWLLILNITVAMLATNFGAVFNWNLRLRRRWTAPELARDVRLFISRWSKPNSHPIPPGLIPPWGLYVNSHYIMEQLLLISVCRKLKEERISLERFKEVSLEIIDAERAEKVFRKAYEMIGHENSMVKQHMLVKKRRLTNLKLQTMVLNQSVQIATVHRKIFGLVAPAETNSQPHWMTQKGQDMELEDMRVQVKDVSASMDDLLQEMKTQRESLEKLRRSICELH